MNKELDRAVGLVKEHLESNRYSYGITRGYLRCYQLLATFMIDNKQQYSRNLAEQWLQSIEYGMCKSTLSTYRLALKKLDMVFRNEELGNTSWHFISTYLSRNPVEYHFESL